MGIVERVPAPAMRWFSRQQFRPVIGPVVRASTSWLRHRPRVVSHGQAAGMRIDPAGANAGYALGTTEPRIQEVFAEQVHPGGVVWDIGANIGFYSLIAARCAGGGRVLAFEPLPQNAEAIRRNLALNRLTNVSVIGLALGDREGTAELRLHSEQTWAKLDTSQDTGFQEELEVTGTIEVEVSTIDHQLQTLAAPDVVKIDIEGAEVAALRGASRLLREVRPTIICELHGTNQAVCDVLESHGYALSTIETPDVPPRQAKWDVHVLAIPAARS
jgi:FkbM family methyltransferase